MDQVKIRVSPSLALIKYWGKADTEKNTPATPSLAVTLGGLYTETAVSFSESDTVFIDGRQAEASRFVPFFETCRKEFGTDQHFKVESVNNFPAAAGLASSSSGFAAIALACNRLCGDLLSMHDVSALARLGSASAARAVFGGFVALKARAEGAEPLFGVEHWPELRIIVVRLSAEPKAVSSREAMERVRKTSPYYTSWLEDAGSLYCAAESALAESDIASLGPLMQQSYLRMFGTMFAASPPVIYWLPESLAVIRLCEVMRKSGIEVWETMDAGPQVKLVCTEDNVDKITTLIRSEMPELDKDALIVCRVGSDPEYIL